MSIDQSVCKHNVVIDGACMMCKKKMTKTDMKVHEALAEITAKRAEPGWVSPLRETNDRTTDTRTYPDTTSL